MSDTPVSPAAAPAPKPAPAGPLVSAALDGPVGT